MKHSSFHKLGGFVFLVINSEEELTIRNVQKQKNDINTI